MDKILEILGKEEIKVRLPDRIQSLSSSEKTKIVDSIAMSNGGRALRVDFNFSHTGKRINRRIYPIKGHKRVADTLANKPLTKDHIDAADNVIGRIVSAQYVPMLDEATAYFKKRRLSPNRLNDLVDSLENLDYKKMADIYKATKLLEDRNWKGVAKVGAVARITDPEAIVRFMDKRYLTFSAEQATSTYTCSECLSDWKKTGPCEHMPGEMYDGNMAFIMCGEMEGEASSVVVNPADDESVVTNWSFSDSDEDMYDSLNKKGFYDMFISESSFSLLDGENSKSIDDCINEYLAAHPEPISHEIDWSLISTLEDSVIEQNILPVLKDKFIKPLEDKIASKESEIVTLQNTVNEKETKLNDSITENKKIKLADNIAYKHLSDKYQAILLVQEKTRNQVDSLLDKLKGLMQIFDKDKELTDLDSVIGFIEQLDLVAIGKKINSGLSQTHIQGTVEDPLDSSTQVNEVKKVDKYKERYFNIKDESGSNAAQQYLLTIKKYGFVANDYNPESGE